MKKERKKFDPLLGPLSQLLPQLMAANLVAPIPLKPVTNPPPKSYNPNAYCEYHSGGAGHWTDRCFPLRHKIQDLIDQGTQNFQEGNKLDIVQNSSLLHGSTESGPSINNIFDGLITFDPSQLITLPRARVRIWLTREEYTLGVNAIYQFRERSVRPPSPEEQRNIYERNLVRCH